MGIIDYVKSINWEYESYPAYEDYIVLPLFALFFPTVRFFLDRFVFQVHFLMLLFSCLVYKSSFLIIHLHARIHLRSSSSLVDREAVEEVRVVLEFFLDL